MSAWCIPKKYPYMFGCLTSHSASPSFALAVANNLGSTGLYVTECIGLRQFAMQNGSEIQVPYNINSTNFVLKSENQTLN